MEKFYEKDEHDAMIVPKRLKEQKNKWLKENFQDGSNPIENYVRHIGQSTAHASLPHIMCDFKFNFDDGRFESHFFDYADDFHVKADFWWIANVGYGAMDLFYGVNQKVNAIVFSDEFLPRIRELKRGNDELKLEMMQSKRFNKFLKPKTN